MLTCNIMEACKITLNVNYRLYAHSDVSYRLNWKMINSCYNVIYLDILFIIVVSMRRRYRHIYCLNTYFKVRNMISVYLSRDKTLFYIIPQNKTFISDLQACIQISYKRWHFDEELSVCRS